MWENLSRRDTFAGMNRYQNNVEYFAEINVLVSIIIKISREFNLTNESQIHNICKNIFQGNILMPLHRNW